jgi:hypothetical protein
MPFSSVQPTQLATAKRIHEEIVVVWEQVLDVDAEDALLQAFEMIFVDQPTDPSTRQLDEITSEDR